MTKRILSITLALLISVSMTVSCTPTNDSAARTTEHTDQTSPITEMTNPTEAITQAVSAPICTLTDLPSTTHTPVAYTQTPLDDSVVLKIAQETTCGSHTVAIICTTDYQYHLVLCNEDGYTSIALLSDDKPFNDHLVTVAPFDNVFGHSGVIVTVPVGANAIEQNYIALDGEEPLLLATTAKATIEQDGMLIEQYTMGGILNLYRMEDGAVVCYDLNPLFDTAFADADQVSVSYYNQTFYESHYGLFLIGIQYPGEIGDRDRYAGWFDDDKITLIHYDDMKLPENTSADTEDTFRTDDAARAWITNVMETDFVLREPLDPTKLDEEALKTYMDDAYTAGIGILSLYEIAPDRMFGGQVLSGNDPAFFCAGEWYYDMKNPAFPTLSAWENYMRRILSDEITDTLAARRDRFISLNGALWGVTGARGSNITMSEAGTAVTSVSDTEIIYTVTVDIVEPEGDLPWPVIDTVTHDFVYSKTEDGWRWTKLYVYN